MKKIIVILLTSMLVLTACNTSKKPTTGPITIEVPTTTEKIVSPKPPEKLTVNGEQVSLASDAYLEKGAVIADSKLIPPTDTFDTMEPINFTSLNGWKVIHVVPSLDTPVCSLQTRQLDTLVNEFADTTFLTISADLPFALKRFTVTNQINNMQVYSDYQNHDFIKNNNLFMPEYQLATRAIIVVDDQNVVQYIEYAEEVTNELNLADAINYLRQNK